MGIKEVTKTEVLQPIYQWHKTTGQFKCPKCDFEAMSGGRIYSHMAETHHLELVGCDWCGFETSDFHRSGGFKVQPSHVHKLM